MSSCTFLQFISHVFYTIFLRIFTFLVAVHIVIVTEFVSFGAALILFLAIMEPQARRLSISSLLVDPQQSPESALSRPITDPEPFRPSLSPTFSSLATLAEVAEQAARREPTLSPTVYTRPIDSLPEIHRPLPPIFTARRLSTPPPLPPLTKFESEPSHTFAPPPVPIISYGHSIDRQPSFQSDAFKVNQSEQDDFDSELLSLVEALPPPVPQASTSKLPESRPKPPPKPKTTAAKKVAKVSFRQCTQRIYQDHRLGSNQGCTR